MPAIITGPPILVDPINYSRQFIPEVNPFLFQDGISIFLVIQAQKAIAGNQPIKVFSVAAATGNSTELDAAHEPPGNITTNIIGLSCALGGNHKIQILRLVNDGGFKQVVTPFNDTTQLYEADSAESVVVVNNLFACNYVRSDGVVIIPTGLFVGGVQRLVVFTVTAGVWAGPTNLDSNTGSNIATYQVAVDSSDRGHLLYRDASQFLEYSQLSPSLVEGSPVLISNTWDKSNIDVLIAGNNLVVTWTENTVLKVAIGTPLSAPVFTTYTVYTAVGLTSISYPALALDKDGNLVVFIILEQASGPTVEQVLMFTFDGISTWNGPVLFYDAVANPPVDAIAFTGPHNFTTLPQFPSGQWIAYVTMDIKPDAGTYSAGFILTNPAPAISIACPVAPLTALVGVFYQSDPPIVSGDTPPDTFTLASGPPWMTINATTGVVSGIPSANGAVTYSIKVTDSLGNTATVASPCPLTVTEGPAMCILPPATPQENLVLVNEPLENQGT